MLRTTVGPLPAPFVRWLRANPGKPLFPRSAELCPVASCLRSFHHELYSVSPERVTVRRRCRGAYACDARVPRWVKAFVVCFDARFGGRERIAGEVTRPLCAAVPASEVLRWLGVR